MPLTSQAAKSSPSEAGFALLEAVIALMILSLIAVICFPRAGAEGGVPLALLRTASAAGALLREDRNAAVAGGRVVASQVDLGRRSIRSGTTGQRLVLAEALRVEARFGSARGRRGVLAFFPDGHSSGGSIDIGQGTLTYRIVVNPLTSAVTIERLNGGNAGRVPS